MRHRVTKTYGHELGLSAAFRQPRAISHCRFLHGYALGFKFVFEAGKLDENGWVMDFGGLKPLKQWLCDTFDHKTLIAADDPALRCFELLNEPEGEQAGGKVIDLIVVPRVGCESFARMAWDRADQLVSPWARNDRGLRLVAVACRAHGANPASYMGERN
jgi:6-pyruvoyltetrahydropterin/6-carboxytetrahydropterin synthase